ncbi:MAG: cupredoxin domain-containing protein [Burkholderiaceae bacterium]|nr:cupredoxin domain-containing protein [Burkholderiaceae bacterium]
MASTLIKPNSAQVAQVDQAAQNERRAFALRNVWFAMLATLLMCASLMLHSNARAEEVAKFEIVAREGRLSPEKLNVPAGVKLRITLRNEGKTPVEFESQELRIEKVVAADAASAVTIQPLKPGTYLMIDEFHADTGKMQIIAK